MSSKETLERLIEELQNEQSVVRELAGAVTAKRVAEIGLLIERAIAAYEKVEMSELSKGTETGFMVGPNFNVHISWDLRKTRLWRLYYKPDGGLRRNSTTFIADELVASDYGGDSIVNGKAGRVYRMNEWYDDFVKALEQYEALAEEQYVRNLDSECNRLNDRIKSMLDNLGVSSVEELQALASEIEE